MARSFLPYAKQSIEDEDIRAVADALKEELITRGPLVQEFEQALSHYCQVPYTVVFSSGTAALMGAYFAAQLNPFDRVISSPNTFIATVGSPISMGIRPFFCDIDLNNGNLDLKTINDYLKFEATRGRPFIVPVHFSGLAVDMAQLSCHISHPDTVVIEDASHALGSYYPTGEKVGCCAFSNMTVFSFHPAKTLTTGEGGAVTTRDPELYHRLQLFRNNGIERSSPYLNKREEPGYYEVHAITGNFNFTSFQAALGLSQLKRLESMISRRRKLVKYYRKRLSQFPHIKFFTDKQEDDSAFHLFVVLIDFGACGTTRAKVMNTLNEKGIGTQVHYIPLYHHPILRCDIELEKERHPNTEGYYRQALSLPLYPDLTEQEVDEVCHQLVSLLSVG